MNTRSLFIRILAALILFFCLAPQALSQQKYAVLISGGRTTIDDQMYHSEFWYDMFNMYRMLIARGYTHANIFVLYGTGTDFASAHAMFQTAATFPGVTQIVDFPNSKADINTFFSRLAAGDAAHGVPQIQPGDSLFYWWMGHGSWDGDDASGDHLYHATIQNTSESVTDAEFAALFAQLPACVVRAAFVMTCHSGALFDRLPALPLAGHSSSRYDQNSFSSLIGGHPHADFSYHAASGLWEQTPAGAAVASDADSDGRLTVQDANVYAHANVASSETVVFDYRGIAPLIALEDAAPAGTVPVQAVYSRDYASDYGAQPSDYLHNVWYEGPDLWTRNDEDGETTHEDPEFGQVNYVYARAHNIGCSSLNATAALSWSEVSTWNTPASWHPIATVNLTGFAAGETRVVSNAWSDVPIPGKYCLHTVLNAPGDAASADGRAYMDNNQVQVNVTVENNVPAWTKVYHFWIENGTAERITADLHISLPKLRLRPSGAVVRLTLPSGLRFEGVEGTLTRPTRDGATIEMPAGGGQVVVKGVALEPREKREAALSVKLPASMRTGGTVAVRVSQHVGKREVGGIVFRTRAAEQRKVVAASIRRLAALTAVFAKAADSRAAREFSGICLKNVRLIPVGRRPFAAFLKDLKRPEPELRRDLIAAGKVDKAEIDRALDALMKAADAERFVAAQEALAHATAPFFRSRVK